MSNTKISKIIQLGEFLSQTSFTFNVIKYVIKLKVKNLKAKSLLIPLRLTAALSATDAAIQRKRKFMALEQQH